MTSAISLYVWMIYDLSWMIPGASDSSIEVPFFDNYYAKPYCRYLPYLFGIVMGYLYEMGSLSLTLTPTQAQKVQVQEKHNEEEKDEEINQTNQ